MYLKFLKLSLKNATFYRHNRSQANLSLSTPVMEGLYDVPPGCEGPKIPRPDRVKLVIMAVKAFIITLEC